MYEPKQGDLIYLDFNPQSGHEQWGKRPALVVSKTKFNQMTKMALVCPITNTTSDFPLHVSLDERTTLTGEVMCEQVKSLDLTARNAQFVEMIPKDLLHEVCDILMGIVEME